MFLFTILHWLAHYSISESKSMWKKEDSPLPMRLEVEFAWNAAPELSIKNAQNATILKNNSQRCNMYNDADF